MVSVIPKWYLDGQVPGRRPVAVRPSVSFRGLLAPTAAGREAAGPPGCGAAAAAGNGGFASALAPLCERYAAGL